MIVHVSQIPLWDQLFSDSDVSAINHHLFLITYIQFSYYILIHVAIKGENYMLH